VTSNIPQNPWVPTASPVVLTLRLGLIRLIRVWLYLLNDAAGRLALKIPRDYPVPAATPAWFRERQKRVKEALGRLFTPYLSLCSGCSPPCCSLYYLASESPLRPSSWVDYLLEEGPREGLALPLTRNSGQVWKILFWHKKAKISDSALLKTTGENEVRLPCPELMEDGCRLPWQSRPSGCILYLCNKLVRHFTWLDFLLYFGLSIILFT
jgi:hypothetical protein